MHQATVGQSITRREDRTIHHVSASACVSLWGLLNWLLSLLRSCHDSSGAGLHGQLENGAEYIIGGRQAAAESNGKRRLHTGLLNACARVAG